MGLIQLEEMEPKVRPRVGYTYMPTRKQVEAELLAADREYDESEEEAESKAEVYSIKKFKRIKPVPGTIGFFVRNIKGGNDAIMEQLKDLIIVDGANNRYSKIREILILWNKADEYSRKRVDIFDILCDKLKMRRRMFYGWVNEALFEFTEEQAKLHLMLHKVDFIQTLINMTKEKRNQGDRRLVAEILKLTEVGSTNVNVEINEGDKVTNQVVVLPSFVKSIRKGEKIEVVENRQLTEGNTDYIDGDIIEEKEEVLVERPNGAKWEAK